MTKEPSKLSRRERQILDVVIRLGSAAVAEVLEALPDPPSYSAVRTTMGILVDKGHLRAKQQGRKYVYRPARSAARLRHTALSDMVKNYFEDSPELLVNTLLDSKSRKLDEAELDRIAEIIDQARRNKS